MMGLAEYINDICDADNCPEETRRKWTVAEIELIAYHIEEAM